MTADWRKLYTQIAAQEAENNRRNRELVLRYPDIAAKLCHPPLHLSRPGNWNGSLPGPYLPETTRGVFPPNRSPVRAQLISIINEAAERADHDSRATTAEPKALTSASSTSATSTQTP
jgi:hypothetical protein